MEIDRTVQLDLLKKLAIAYPYPVSGMAYPELGMGKVPLTFHLAYLEEHGLVKCNWSSGLEGRKVINATITARGIDLLAEDGGLSAILGVVTIRLHDDTLKSLIEAKILEADLPPADKSRYIDQLRELPAETTKHLVLKLVDKGLEGGPQAMVWLGKWLAGL